MEGIKVARWCQECRPRRLARWVRKTQFSCNHYFCDEHARQEKDFGQKTDVVWEELVQNY
jgi:hypothetical protein